MFILDKETGKITFTSYSLQSLAVIYMYSLLPKRSEFMLMFGKENWEEMYNHSIENPQQPTLTGFIGYVRNFVKQNPGVVLHKPSKPKLSFWFMRDNHTFIKFFGRSLEDVVGKAVKISSENPYGMVCGVKIIENGNETGQIGENCHVNKEGIVDLSNWIESLKTNSVSQKYFTK